MATDARPAMLPVSPPSTPAATRERRIPPRHRRPLWPSGIRLRTAWSGVYDRGRAEATRSSNPQRGLILTDPSLWVEAATSVTSSLSEKTGTWNSRHATSAAPSFAAHLDATDTAGPARGGRRDVVRSISRPVRAQFWAAAATQLDLHGRPRPATRLGPQARNYQATLAVGNTISTIVGGRVRTHRRADRDALRPGHRRRDDRLPPASCR